MRPFLFYFSLVRKESAQALCGGEQIRLSVLLSQLLVNIQKE
jgi:hypothetical protein